MAKTNKNDAIDTAIELTQDTAKATLNAGVKTAEVTEDYIQGLYKVGYDANVDALKVVKGYWDTTSKIRQDWVKLFANTGENLIDATANMELPLQKEVMDISKNVVNNVQDTFENLTAKAKTATK